MSFCFTIARLFEVKNCCSHNVIHHHDHHLHPHLRHHPQDHHDHHHHHHRVSVWRTAAATVPPGDSPPLRLASTLQTPGRCDHWLGTWRASSTRLVVPWYFQTWYLQPWIYQLVIRSGQGHLRGTPGWWLFSTGGIIKANRLFSTIPHFLLIFAPTRTLTNFPFINYCIQECDVILNYYIIYIIHDVSFTLKQPSNLWCECAFGFPSKIVFFTSDIFLQLFHSIDRNITWITLSIAKCRKRN